MARKGIYDGWSSKKNVRKYYGYARQIANQSQIADELRQQKNSIVNNYNKNDFDKGMNWFYEGISLDEAPEKLKDNVSFIAGYERSKRIRAANDLSYNTGVEYYEKGYSLEEIPKMYRDNPFFMDGYNKYLKVNSETKTKRNGC